MYLKETVSWAIWTFFPYNNSAFSVIFSFNTYATPDFKIREYSYILCNHKGLLQLTSFCFGTILHCNS